MTIWKTLAALAAATALAGCNGVIVYEFPGPQISYFEGDFDYATHKGAIVTEIHGNPFNMSAGAFRKVVLSYMDRQNRGVPAHFTAEPSDRTLPPYKVVVVFNPVRWASAVTLCEDGKDLPGEASGNTVRVAMAFCFGGQPKTEVAGRVAGVGGPDDPRFRALVRQVTRGLIPPGDDEETGEDGGVPG